MTLMARSKSLLSTPMDALEHITGTVAPSQLSSLRDGEVLHDDVCDQGKMSAFVESSCARIFL